jgi:hypothetical protein
MRILRRLSLLPLLGVLVAGEAPARARPGYVLHERVPSDPREDVALGVALDGDLPAAIETKAGLVPAPDPRRPPGKDDAPYAPGRNDASPDSTFHPDRDTRRPDVLPYDEPFTPSTAPFKRLNAYDAIDASYTLSVRDKRMSALIVAARPVGDHEDHFYADMVVDLQPGKLVRIPSVGPGARILRARAGVGSADVPVHFERDGAENWFVQGEQMARARLVMEIAIPRSAFGGEIADASWADLGQAPPLAPAVARAAAEVAQHVGVSRAQRPREAVAKLVTYFRSFQDADEGPAPTRDIYLDLALSKKGVCRHRSFAFFVTALSLGIPTRVITNEAHAWVEVFDGRAWRRVDLGGAGRTLHDPSSSNVPYDPPSDPFQWPAGSTRGAEMADRGRQDSQTGPGQPSPQGGSGPRPSPSAAASAFFDPSSRMSSGGASSSRDPAGASSSGPTSSLGASGDPSAADERPRAKIALTVLDAAPKRGAGLAVRGEVTAEGERCAHVMVEVVLRNAKGGVVPAGSLATDERGAFDGSLVLPSAMALGDYDVVAFTGGDARCGAGSSQ